MKVGLDMLLAENPAVGRAPSYAEIRDLARRAERAGFDSLWLYDHLIYRPPDRPPRGIWECWTVLAALAEATARIEIGTLVACTAFRNPAVLAKMATTLDEVSGGRFTLGLGAGWNEAEFTAFGMPFDHRVDRFEEALQIIVPLVRQGQVDFRGRYYRAIDCELLPRGPRPNGPPVLIGAFGPRMLRLAARYADIWNGGYVARPAELDGLRTNLMTACAEVGRDPATLPLTAELKVAFPDLGSPPAFMKDDYLTGPAEEIASALGAFEAAGLDQVMCHCAPNTPATLARLGEALERYRSQSG